MADKEIDTLKKEIEELRKQNEQLSKALKTVFDKISVPGTKVKEDSESKVRAQEQIERDLQDLKNKKSSSIEEPSGKVRVERDSHDSYSGDIEIDFQGLVKNAQAIAQKAVEHLQSAIKNIAKAIETETERLRYIPEMTEELFAELKADFDDIRAELEEARLEYERARNEVRDAERTLRRIKRDIMYSHGYTDSKKIEELNTAEEKLDEALNNLEASRREIIKTRRSFANLLKRAKVLKVSDKLKKEKKLRKSVVFSGDFDWGNTISEYFEGIMGSIIRNLEKSLKSSLGEINLDSTIEAGLLSKKSGDSLFNKSLIKETDEERFVEEATKLLSALGDSNRLKILRILEKGPEFQKELSEKSGLKGGTFKHHTDILNEAGFITREAVRGRYLITQLGVEALKLAEILYTRKVDIDKAETEEGKDGEYEIGIE